MPPPLPRLHVPPFPPAGPRTKIKSAVNNKRLTKPTAKVLAPPPPSLLLLEREIWLRLQHIIALFIGGMRQDEDDRVPPRSRTGILIEEPRLSMFRIIEEPLFEIKYT